MASELVEAIWKGPVGLGVMADGRNLQPGDTAMVTTEDLKSSWWEAVKPVKTKAKSKAAEAEAQAEAAEAAAEAAEAAAKTAEAEAEAAAEQPVEVAA